MKKLICYIFGHSFKYNFIWMPNKRICKRCYKKEMWTCDSFFWDNTFTDKRTNEELVKKWHFIKI